MLAPVELDADIDSIRSMAGINGRIVVGQKIGHRKLRYVFRSQSDGYVCHLAIVSEGLTISETLQYSEHEPTKIALNKYLFVQKQIAKSSDPPSLLRTLMSLQPGITRVETEGAFGGTGFPKVIDWLNNIGGGVLGRQPQLTIISGACCLTLKDLYNHRRAAVGGLGDGKFIFFNSGNSFTARPDPQYVFTLQQSFPGTISQLNRVACMSSG